jgi:hypothetical protein
MVRAIVGAAVGGIGFAVDVAAGAEIDVAVGVAARVGRGVDVIDDVACVGRRVAVDAFFVAVGVAVGRSVGDGSIVSVAIAVGLDVGDASDLGGTLGTRRSTMTVGVIVGAIVGTTVT